MMKFVKHFAPNLGTILIVSLFLLVQSAAGSPPAPAALSQAPSATLISYQGRLANADGNPLSGDYQMRFSFYEGPTTAEADYCWRETQTVSVSDGLFNVLLGSVNDIDPSCLEGDVYLGIKVGSDSEMTPRELLASVPFATQASTVPNESITPEKLKLVGGNIGIGLTNPVSPLQLANNGSSGSVDDFAEYQILLYQGVQPQYSYGLGIEDNALWFNSDRDFKFYRDGSHADLVLNDGKVGIGTASPDEKLEVAGDIQLSGQIDWGWNNRAILVTDVNGADPGGKVIRFKNSMEEGFDNKDGGFEFADSNDDVKMKITEGNVGIGTAYPEHKLDVRGDIGLQGTLDMHGNSIANVSDSFKAPDADKLDGKDSSDFANSAHNHDGRYVNTNGDTMSGGLTIDGNVYLSSNKQFQVDADGARIRFGYDSDQREGFLAGQARNLRLSSGWNEGISLVAGQGGIKFDTQTSGSNRTTRMKLAQNGTLEAKGDVVVGKNLHVQGSDFNLTGRNSGGTGNPGRALVDGDDRLYINFNNDFSGWEIGGPAKANLNMGGNSINNCGALVEANLQTPEELAAERIERFEEGDLLCWGIDQLEKCASAGDPLVQAVADKNGRPIIIGAEVIKVVGPVKRGDLLVASSVPGYASVNNDPGAGTVIAQALEDFAGEKGIIKAMIRKF